MLFSSLTMQANLHLGANKKDSLGVYYHDFLITQKRGNVKYRRAFRHSSGPDD